MLTTLAVGMLIGSIASASVLRWGARLDRRRLARIASWGRIWLSALLLVAAVGTLAPDYPLERADTMAGATGYVAMAATMMARSSLRSRWRAALYGATLVLLFSLLAESGGASR